MSKCLKCNVNIASSTNICPLCNNPIKVENVNDVFPIIEYNYKNHKFLYNLLKFLSIVAIFVCIFSNFIVSRTLSWSLFVVAGIISFWLTLITAIKGRKHFIRMLFAEMILIILISFMWDYFTGFNKWSINYCLPFICSIYTIAILIMRLFRKRLAKEFIFYATINSLIGLVPGILIIFNKVDFLWPSFISVIISLVILAFLLVFNKKQMKNELERRFHI